MECKSVLVGVSGGVDSSVAVDLLKKQGYKVYGVVINFNKHSQGAIDDAKKVGEQLDIPVSVADAQQSFEENVVMPFCQNYIDGKTPNPCVVCNPLVKFKTLISKADELGIDFVATGHYAQLEKNGETVYVKKAASTAKDQSYMLYRLPQDILKRLILPLGSYEKSEIREMAKNIGLFTADKPDSQEICFIPSGDHAKFIEEKGFRAKKGNFISPDGKKLGTHLGIHHYTIGQRKGLNIALGKPVFVKEISENGDILLGFSGEEFFTQVTLSQPVYTKAEPFSKGEVFSAKIRSASKGEDAMVEFSDESTLILNFVQPVRAAAKGQSVVLYRDNLLVGGGFIAQAAAKK